MPSTAFTQHDAHCNRSHNRAAMTSPFPCHIRSSTDSTELEDLAPHCITAPVPIERERRCSSSVNEARFSAKDASPRDVPVYVPPDNSYLYEPLQAQAIGQFGTRSAVQRESHAQTGYNWMAADTCMALLGRPLDPTLWLRLNACVTDLFAVSCMFILLELVCNAL
jgi:hypothetical protein